MGCDVIAVSIVKSFVWYHWLWSKFQWCIGVWWWRSILEFKAGVHSQASQASLTTFFFFFLQRGKDLESTCRDNGRHFILYETHSCYSPYFGHTHVTPTLAWPLQVSFLQLLEFKLTQKTVGMCLNQQQILTGALTSDQGACYDLGNAHDLAAWNWCDLAKKN